MLNQFSAHFSSWIWNLSHMVLYFGARMLVINHLIYITDGTKIEINRLPNSTVVLLVNRCGSQDVALCVWKEPDIVTA